MSGHEDAGNLSATGTLLAIARDANGLARHVADLERQFRRIREACGSGAEKLTCEQVADRVIEILEGLHDLHERIGRRGSAHDEVVT